MVTTASLLDPHCTPSHLDTRHSGVRYRALVIEERCNLVHRICIAAAVDVDDVLEGQAQGIVVDTEAHTSLGTVAA